MGDAHSGGQAATAAAGHDDHGHGMPNLAHHFDTMSQQVEACKLGMWLFLCTEVLLFAGLFCAYAVYRSNHPEVFVWASRYLDVKLGGLNTIILLLSSFTAALAVRYAQLKDRNKLCLMLVLTLAGAGGFLVVKFFEYKSKIDHGTLWGARYAPHDPPPPHAHIGHAEAAKPKLAGYAEPINVTLPWDDKPALSQTAGSLVPTPKNEVAVTAVDGKVLPPAPPAEAEHGAPHEGPITPAEIHNAHIFFGIYFIMTGTHGLHVILGMAAITWVLLRARRGDFDGGYFLPVDLVALYWHIVDLIWIYLFPLLYLIG